MKVPAFRKDNGERVYVPEHWLGHKTLGRPFRKTPPPDAPAAAPSKTPAPGDITKKES